MRAEVLAKNVRQKGGKVFSLEFLNWSYKDSKEMFLVTSKFMGKSDFLKILPSDYHKELDQYVLIDCEWVSKCLRECILVDPLDFYLKWNG